MKSRAAGDGRRFGPAYDPGRRRGTNPRTSRSLPRGWSHSSSFRDAACVRRNSLMQATLVYDGIIAGTLSARADGRGLVFSACHPDFGIIQGSTFANRHAAQKAVDRVAQTQGLAGHLWADASPEHGPHEEIRRIRHGTV